MKPPMSFQKFKSEEKRNRRVWVWCMFLCVAGLYVTACLHSGWVLLITTVIWLVGFFFVSRTDNIVTHTYRWSQAETDEYYQNHPRENKNPWNQ